MDPFILIKFSKAQTTEGDPLASLVIFEWNDEELIGEYRSSDSDVGVPHAYKLQLGAISKLTDGQQVKDTICEQGSVDAGLCAKEDIGSFILTKNATDVSKNAIISKAIHLNDPEPIKYPVKKTGFYCVSTYAYSDEDYYSVVTFRNAYGELPAAQIAKLPFYGAMTIVYAVIGL